MSEERLKNQLKNIEIVSNAVRDTLLFDKVYFFGGLSCKALHNYRLHDDSDFIVLGKSNYNILVNELITKYHFSEVSIPFFKGFSVKFFENTKLKNAGTVEIRYVEKNKKGGWKFVIPVFAYLFTNFKPLGISNIVFEKFGIFSIKNKTIKTLPLEYSYILKSYGKTKKDLSDVKILNPIVNKQLVKLIKKEAKKHNISLTMNRILFNFCRSRCNYGLDKKQYLSLNS